jgi:ribosomal protein S18 acetylase RimI-like enzyme
MSLKLLNPNDPTAPIGDLPTMSKYAKYLLEKTTDEIIETHFGFVTFRFLNPNQVYIIDIYVEPELRSEGLASSLADQVVKTAKERGCKEVLGTVTPSMKNSTQSIRVLLGYGMHLDSATNNLIVFKKEI